MNLPQPQKATGVSPWMNGLSEGWIPLHEIQYL